MANGMLAHSDETDDTHSFSQSHPGCSVIPAALAAGEQFGIDGTRFVRAVALGYDIGPRVTATLGRLSYMAETHRSTHSISGTFGSAAAAACAANLNAQQMRWLLSYTAQQASGLASWQRDTDHIEKAFDFGGMPARNGVTAALLVQAGGTGVEDVFSGADNFFQAFLPKNNAELVIEKLGERYEVTRTSFKKWTVGAPIQAVLDALENIFKKNRVEADQVKQVLVKLATNEAAKARATDPVQIEWLRTASTMENIHGMCEDYRAAASIDLQHDKADLDRKITCPLSTLWGERGPMGRLYDVLAIWKERV